MAARIDNRAASCIGLPMITRSIRPASELPRAPESTEPVAIGRPICAILDDVHRADADTWFLLEELGEIRNSSLLFALEYRDDEPPVH